MTAQILNKLLHLPTVRMKEAAVSADGAAYADAVRHLFGLEDERRLSASTAAAVVAPSAFLRVRLASRRAAVERAEVELCSSASARAALGSR